MQGNTNRPVSTNGTLSTSPSSPATPFLLKTDLEIHIRNTDRPIVDPLRPLQMPAITKKEVCQAVQRAAPNKAPGPDGIPNLTLHRALAIPAFLSHLTNLFNACLQLGYYPEHFQKSTTVVLRKPGKLDYADPKAYRPIALLNTIGKALEAVITTRISYMVEVYSLLPDPHWWPQRAFM